MPQTEQKDDTVFVTPSYDLSGSDVSVFREELREHVEAGHYHLTVDLAGVSDIDGNGLSVLIQCQNSLDQYNGTLVVLTDNTRWKDLFEVTRLDGHFAVRETV